MKDYVGWFRAGWRIALRLWKLKKHIKKMGDQGRRLKLAEVWYVPGVGINVWTVDEVEDLEDEWE